MKLPLQLLPFLFLSNRLSSPDAAESEHEPQLPDRHRMGLAYNQKPILVDRVFSVVQNFVAIIDVHSLINPHLVQLDSRQGLYHRQLATYHF